MTHSIWSQSHNRRPKFFRSKPTVISGDQKVSDLVQKSWSTPFESWPRPSRSWYRPSSNIRDPWISHGQHLQGHGQGHQGHDIGHQGPESYESEIGSQNWKRRNMGMKWYMPKVVVGEVIIKDLDSSDLNMVHSIWTQSHNRRPKFQSPKVMVNTF